VSQPPGLRVLSTLAVMGAMRELASRHKAATGVAIDADFAPTLALLARLRSGEAADVVILTREGLDELAQEGLVVPDSRVDIALSRVGLAVAAGAEHPDISTVDALRRTLLDARAVAYSRIGASGLFFAGLLDKLGIAKAVNASAHIIPGGFTAELLVRGEADLAIQQISELMMVPGVDIVGPVPAELQAPATFSAGRLVGAADTADALLRFLSASDIAPILRTAGLESPHDR
jgi:molybdate transport system substrate-binding protein